MGRLINADIVTAKLETLDEYYETQSKAPGIGAVSKASMFGRMCGVTQSKSIIDDTPTIEAYTREEVLWLMQNEYRRGWHHALNKALNESYSIHCEEGTFDVVQNETLMGLGMYMDSALGESCDSILQEVKAYGVTKCGEKHDSN